MSAGVTAVLLIALWNVDPERYRLLYDLTMTGIGASLSVAIGLSVVDWIVRKRDREEWSVVRDIALWQVCNNVSTAVSEIQSPFILGIKPRLDPQLSLDSAGKSAVQELRILASELEALNDPIRRTDDYTKASWADSLIERYEFFSPPMKDVFNVYLMQLVASHADPALVERIVQLQFSYRTLDRHVLDQRRLVTMAERTTKPPDPTSEDDKALWETRRSAMLIERKRELSHWSMWPGFAGDVVGRAADVFEVAWPLVRKLSLQTQYGELLRDSDQKQSMEGARPDPVGTADARR